MAHNPSCERAKNPGCVCTGCGGSLHGWPTRIEFAERATESQLAELRRDAELLWLTKLGTGKHRENKLLRPPDTLKRAAAQGVEAEALIWLAHNRDHIEPSRELGQGLHTDVRTALRERVSGASGPLTAEQVDRSTPGHFWCTLLAELAGAGDSIQNKSGRVPEVAKELLREDQNPAGWGQTQDALADHAMGLVWKCVCAALLGDFTDLLLVTRLMSLFLCPDPAGHPALAQRSLLPLAKDIGGEGVEDVPTRLMRAYGIDSEP